MWVTDVPLQFHMSIAVQPQKEDEKEDEKEEEEEERKARWSIHCVFATVQQSRPAIAIVFFAFFLLLLLSSSPRVGLWPRGFPRSWGRAGGRVPRHESRGAGLTAPPPGGRAGTWAEPGFWPLGRPAGDEWTSRRLLPRELHCLQILSVYQRGATYSIRRNLLGWYLITLWYLMMNGLTIFFTCLSYGALYVRRAY